MSRRRTIVNCPSCGVIFDLWGSDPRCPGCNKRYQDVEAEEDELSPSPAWRGGFTPLEEPEFLGLAPKREPETAPASEFVAAGLLFAAFLTTVAGFILASALLFLLGLASMGLIGLIVAGWKIRKNLYGTRRDDGLESPGLIGWLLGYGYWRRR